jgi:hypothetical protein
VVISACSDVSLDDIESGLSGWFTVSSEPLDFHHLAYYCISPEKADVTGTGYVVQEEAWRLGGCLGGNALSLFGSENHVRIWAQPAQGGLDAWFITASFETACIVADGKLVPYASLRRSYGHNLFHCVDGGPGSYGSDGYDRGALAFVNDIKAAAADEDWAVTVDTVTRPLTGGVDRGEDGAPFSDVVYVVTVRNDVSQ